MATWTDDQQKLIEILVAVGSILSVIGCLFIIGSYIWFSFLRKFAFKLVVWIAIGDLVGAIARLMGDPPEGPICNLQSILMTLGDLTALFWVAVVAYVVDGIRKRKLVTEESMPYFYAFVFIPTILLTFLPFATDSVGAAGGWCWIRGDTTADKIWRMLTFYVPLWITFGYLVWVYLSLFRMLNHNKNLLNADQLSLLKKVKWYPLVLVIGYFFASVRRIIDIFSDDTPFWMAILHFFLSSLMGLMNAVVYGLTPSVIKTLQEAVTCTSRRPSEDDGKGGVQLEERGRGSTTAYSVDEPYKASRAVSDKINTEERNRKSEPPASSFVSNQRQVDPSLQVRDSAGTL